MTLGHRIVVMREGVILQMDVPEVIYNRPVNAFVARFIGSPPMNLFKGRIEERRGGLSFAGDDEGVEIALPVAWQQPLRQRLDRPILLGIRPENISAREETTPGSADIVVPVTATAVEMLGPQKLVYFRLGQEMAVASFEPDHPVRATDRVETVWNGSKLHLFDGESEERLELQPARVAAG